MAQAPIFVSAEDGLGSLFWGSPKRMDLKDSKDVKKTMFLGFYQVSKVSKYFGSFGGLWEMHSNWTGLTKKTLTIKVWNSHFLSQVAMYP